MLFETRTVKTRVVPAGPMPATGQRAFLPTLPMLDVTEIRTLQLASSRRASRRRQNRGAPVDGAQSFLAVTLWERPGVSLGARKPEMILFRSRSLMRSDWGKSR
jgi:hypothetical protein